MTPETREGIDRTLNRRIAAIARAPSAECARSHYMRGYGAVEVLEAAGLINLSEAEYWRCSLAHARVAKGE